MPKEIFEKLKCLQSQDYLLRELLSRGLWKPAMTCCDMAIRKRQSDIETFEVIKEAIKEKINDAT